MHISFKGQTREVRMILLDLDGTLLNDAKEVSGTCVSLLREIAAQDTEIVPCTGRFYEGMPEEVKALDFVHYVIGINGAQICDVREGRMIGGVQMPLRMALSMMQFLDTQDVIYDCYIGNEAFMSAAHMEEIDRRVTDAYYATRVRAWRRPVPDLKQYVTGRGDDISKIQLFTEQAAVRAFLLAELPVRFPKAAVSTSLSCNIEINAHDANKGEAMRTLAAYLRIPAEQVMAFGDGVNDLTMLRDAGIGIAMGNAAEEVKAVADDVTASNAEDGVAKALDTLWKR